MDKVNCLLQLCLPLREQGFPTPDIFDPRQNVELFPRNLHVSMETMENLVPLATGTRPEDRPHHSSQKNLDMVLVRVIVQTLLLQ